MISAEHSSLRIPGWPLAIWYGLTAIAQMAALFVFAKTWIDLRHGAFLFAGAFVVTAIVAPVIWTQRSRHDSINEVPQGMALSLKILLYSWIVTGFTYLILDITCASCSVAQLGAFFGFLIFMFEAAKASLIVAPIAIISGLLHSFLWRS